MLCLVVNPIIDRHIHTESVVLGTVTRSKRDTSLPGGKPVDVARAARAVGVTARLLALLPEQGSNWFLAALAEEGSDCQSVGYEGTVRQTIVLFEEDGRTTVINGQGAPVPPETWQHYCRQAAAMTGPGEWVVISGSFPPGLNQVQTGQLVTAIRHAGGRIALDTGPTWLSWLLAHEPDLVTPNLAEANACLTGQTVVEAVEVSAEALPQAALAAIQLTQAGAKRAVVTAGRAGLAWSEPGRHGQLDGLEVDVASPIGAGDALLGGLVGRLESGAAFTDAINWGMAAAASAIGQWIPGQADPASTQRWHRAIVQRVATF